MLKNIKNGPVTSLIGLVVILLSVSSFFFEFGKDLTEMQYLAALAIGFMLFLMPDFFKESLRKLVSGYVSKKSSNG